MANTSTFSSSDGDGYEAQMGRWSKRLAPLMVDFAGLASAQSVLDVGCGTGSLAFELARNPNIRSVEGIDLCPAYIAYADRRARNSRPRFLVADACALPFPEATFDHSLSCCSSFQMRDAQRAK
jgi:ubiquinone/menaquinone biosynthesis C-methylase UbiE